MKVRIYALLLVSICLSGCLSGDLQESYIEADRATYDQVAPRFLKYVKEDKAMDADKATDLEGLCHSWDLRIKKGEQAVADKKAKKEDAE